MNSDLNDKLDKAMTTEQFTQVVEAILEGKYSWACVLILRFSGYNPFHYIPYRTYNRLMKDNCQNSRKSTCPKVQSSVRSCSSTYLSHSTDIRDLNYLEPLNDEPVSIRGGHTVRDFNSDWKNWRNVSLFFRGSKDLA